MAGDDFTLKLGADNKNLLSGLRQAGSSITQFTGSAKAAIAGLTAGLGLSKLTADFMNYHTNLSNVTQVMGYNIANVEAIGGAMRRFGGDTSGAVSSLDNLTSALQQATQSGTGPLVETAQRFGVSFMKTNGQLMNSEELLQSLSKQLNTYDASTKRAIASQLGLDAALLRVIDSGNFDSMVASQKKLGLSTAEDAKLASQMESAWLDLKDSFTQVAREISRIVVPILVKLMRWIQSILVKIKEFKGTSTLALGAVAAGLTPVILQFTSFAAVIGKTAGSLGVLKTALGATTGAVKLLMAPVTRVLAVFGLLFLLLEDLYVWSQGGKSVIGDMFGDMPNLQDKLRIITDPIQAVWDTIKGFWEWVSSLTWDGFVIGLQNAGIRIQNAFIGIFNFIKKQINSLAETITGNSAVSWALGKLGIDAGSIPKLEYTKELELIQNPATLQPAGTQVINNTQQTINMEISGAASPEATAKAVEDRLQGVAKLEDHR